MNLFDQFFGSSETSLSPDALRAALFDAANRPDDLAALCHANRESILQHFPAWKSLPVPIRSQPAEAQNYVNGIVAIARCFEQSLGDASLMQQLTAPGNNPIERWDAGLKSARQLMQELRLDEAAERLTDLAIDVGRLKGTAVDSYLPVVLGTLGECRFQSGKAQAGLDPTRQALAMVRKTGDADGILAYLGNLYEMHRYLGQKDEASRCAEELATTLAQRGDSAEAERYRKQATLVRAGEPLVRVVVSVEGKRYELDEVLTGVEGSIQFLFERNRLALGPSQVLTKRAEAIASEGRFAEALSFFVEAMEADPFNPQPVYEAGLTCMYLGRPSEGADYYERTEELAPGWFHCRTEGWLARQIAAGRYPSNLFETLHTVQDGPLQPAVKMQLVRKALEQAPDLALLHHMHGKLLVEAQQKSAAEAAFRRGLAVCEEPDIRTRLLVDTSTVVDADEERYRLCREARELNGNLVASATAAIVLAFA